MNGSSKGEDATPKLTIPRVEAQEKLAARIEKGQELQQRVIRSEQELDEAQHDYSTWHEYNERLLAQMFTNSSEADNYRVYDVILFVYPATMSEQIETYRSGVAADVRQLRSLVEQLELITVAADVLTSEEPPENATRTSDNKVFVVHGHDKEAKETVARFLERLNLQAIVLSEQVNAGRTLIEKFEYFADVAYAVVLLTPDDLGAPKGAFAHLTQENSQEDVYEVLEPRARQNVIFELGFFFGQLRRKRVCALLSEDIEQPSDIHGVVYISMKGDWRLSLARELREAGLDVDLNNAM